MPNSHPHSNSPSPNLPAITSDQDAQVLADAANQRAGRPRYGKYITWRDGIPIPTYTEPITPQNMTQLLVTSTQLEYKPLTDSVTGLLKPGEAEHIGKSKLEVAVERRVDAAAYGDPDALEWIYDRAVGKAKQSVETVSMTMTYQDFLQAAPEPTSEDLADIEITVIPTPASSAYIDPLEGI